MDVYIYYIPSSLTGLISQLIMPPRLICICYSHVQADETSKNTANLTIVHQAEL